MSNINENTEEAERILKDKYLFAKELNFMFLPQCSELKEGFHE